MNQLEKAVYFRQLHGERPLVLPNAWDAARARVIEAAGAKAIATGSAGVAWANGYRDGQQISRDEMLRAIRAITRVVKVPVTADMEGGYGDGSVAAIAETVRGVIDAGAVGINLEDSPGPAGAALLAVEVHAERIRAARATAVAVGADLVINARTDVYLRQVGAPESRFAAAVARANSYRAAGADSLFVPGVIDAETIGALVAAIDGPINILAMPGAPTMGALGELGVARVSLGPFVALAALAVAQRAAHELLTEGTYHTLAGHLSFGEVNQLFG